MSHACPGHEPELSAYLDGELEPPARAALEAHLRSCEPCARVLRRLRSVSAALRRWDAHETRYATSTGFRNRVYARLGVEAGPEERVGAGRPVLLSRFAWRAAAAAALVAAGAAGFASLAPRFGVEDRVSVARLDENVRQLRRLVADLDAGRAAMPAGAVPRAPDLVRVGPLDSIVRPVPEGEVAAGEESAQADVPVWEEHGGGRILRDALPDDDAFRRERRMLAIEEEVRRTRAERLAAASRATHAPPPLSPLATLLGELRVAEGNYPPYEQVQVWPIELTGAARRRPAEPLLTTEQAIDQQTLDVREGQLPGTVAAVNEDLKRPVLILAGDVLVGGRQDRLARDDVLLAPGQRLSVATYGSGRARPRTSYKRFTSSRGIAPTWIRSLLAADRSLLDAPLGQSAIDAAVARTVRDLATPAEPGSLDNIYNSNLLGEADQYVKVFEKRLADPAIVGFVVAAGSRVLGADVFGDRQAFVEHRTRVLRSYVLEALATTHLEGVPPGRETVAKWFAALPRCVFHDESASGAGAVSVFRDIEGAAFGYGLTNGARLVHAVVFPGVPQDIPAAAMRTGRRASGEGVGAPDSEGPSPGLGPTRGTEPPPPGVTPK